MKCTFVLCLIFGAALSLPRNVKRDVSEIISTTPEIIENDSENNSNDTTQATQFEDTTSTVSTPSEDSTELPEDETPLKETTESSTKTPEKKKSQRKDTFDIVYSQQDGDGSSVFNTFFPILFTGNSGRSLESDTTAIANSFSTGGRGKASSKANTN